MLDSPLSAVLPAALIRALGATVFAICDKLHAAVWNNKSSILHRRFIIVDPKDREAYEQGVRDSNRRLLEEIVSDAVDAALPSTMNESQEAAYYKGRRGEQFDKDKEDDDE